MPLLSVKIYTYRLQKYVNIFDIIEEIKKVSGVRELNVEHVTFLCFQPFYVKYHCHDIMWQCYGKVDTVKPSLCGLIEA